ncbi:MAG: HIT family protein [Pseudomonadota bacterium]
MNSSCPLCAAQAENILWRDAQCRVILIADADYPGFCRVVWNAHVKEMTDLSEPERAHFMRVVFAVEAVLRAAQHPDKINLASLGNQTPHLHWHVIPRYADDAHFPNAVWSAALRAGAPRRAPDTHALQTRLSALLNA